MHLPCDSEEEEEEEDISTYSLLPLYPPRSTNLSSLYYFLLPRPTKESDTRGILDLIEDLRSGIAHISTLPLGHIEQLCFKTCRIIMSGRVKKMGGEGGG